MGNIIVATAEPFGNYHLAPFNQVSHLTHFLCYPQPIANVAVKTSADVKILDTANLLVITGGCWTAWTALVAREAERRNLPIVFSQLAYGPGVSYMNDFFISLNAATVFTEADRVEYCKYLSVDKSVTTVTGDPRLDNLPTWKPHLNELLIVPSVSAQVADEHKELHAFAVEAQKLGWKVVVQLHPREDPQRWKGFTLDKSANVELAAVHARVVAGVTGSAFLPLAVMGVPLISLSSSGVSIGNHIKELSAHNEIFPSVQKTLSTATPALARKVRSAVGEVGDATQRVVKIWEDHSR